MVAGPSWWSQKIKGRQEAVSCVGRKRILHHRPNTGFTNHRTVRDCRRLKYFQKTYRSGIPVDGCMVGSYYPKEEAHSYMTPAEDAPSNMFSRASNSLRWNLNF